MKKLLKGFIVFIGLILGGICYNLFYSPNISNKQIFDALEFCKRNNLNTDYCIFVDFSEHQGKKRYSIYNFNTREIEYSSVCVNGLNKNKFSNVEGSHLSSLGKYKITSIVSKMGIGEEGLIIEGLEFTNNNARKREILIHSHTSVYYNPGTYPFSIFHKNLSWGCFVIDKKAFKITKKISKPTLLWAYK